jgi:uncharacterized RDD family membrane protein YckC
MDKKRKNDQSPGAEVYELAGIVQRLAASLVDSVLLVVLLTIVMLLVAALSDANLPGQLAQFVGFAVPVAYHWYFWTRRDGQTPGKFALGIKVIKADGSAITDVDAVIRAIGYNVSALLFGLGFFWALLDRNNQTWHDKIGRTFVVRNHNQRRVIEIKK